MNGRTPCAGVEGVNMNAVKKRAGMQSVLCIVLLFPHVCVAADSTLTARRAVTPRGEGKAIYGRIATLDDKPVAVNGNSVCTGATVMSGSRIVTPAGVSASIQLWPLGRIELAQNTTLQVTYREGFVDIDLLAGCAILTTEAGVAGSVRTPQGTTERTGPEVRAFVDVCTGEQGAAAPVVNEGAAARAGAGVCIGPLLFPPVEAARFSPYQLLFGLAPILLAAIYAVDRDGRPPVASPSG